MVTFKHNEIKKATLPYVQMAANKEYLVDSINDYYTWCFPLIPDVNESELPARLLLWILGMI